MPQRITLTGEAKTNARLVNSMSDKKHNAFKVYTFDIQEKGTSNHARRLPKAKSILFTVFVNDRQLRRAKIDPDDLQKHNIVV